MAEGAGGKGAGSVGAGLAKPEVRSLTGLRGVAACYVVWLHYVDPTSFSSIYKTFVAHGYLAVDLFFVLSGLVMAMNYRHMFASRWSWKSYVKFLGRRIARVYPLYLLVTLIAYFMSRVDFHPGIFPFSSLNRMLGLNLLMVQSWGFVHAWSLDLPAWSISAEWAAYLIFPLLLIPTLFRKPLAGWLAGAASVGVLATLCLLPVSVRHGINPGKLLDFTEYKFGLPVVRCIAEFVLGLLTFRVATTAFGQRMQSRGVAFGVCIAILVLLTIPKTDLLVVLLYPILMLSLLSNAHLPSRVLSSGPFELLGVLSYAIYLLHETLGGVFYWVQTEGQHHGVVHAASYTMALRFPVVLVFAFIANRLVEAPGRRLLRRLFEKDADAAIRKSPLVAR